MKYKYSLSYGTKEVELLTNEMLTVEEVDMMMSINNCFGVQYIGVVDPYMGRIVNPYGEIA